MSKRAEELARKIDCMTNRVDINLDIPKAAEMIDAELRRERERCAQRMIMAYNGRASLKNVAAMRDAVLEGGD